MMMMNYFQNRSSIYTYNYQATKQSFNPPMSALFCKRESKKATTDVGRHG